MSYQVLARKWRPQRFSEVVGQQHVLSALENGLREGRLHHAYLFSGTRGVGKTSIARLFAKGLNCETGITATPCGECANCKAIEEGRFIDLIEIDAASRTKVEDTRELLDNVQYKPTVGRFKVYLIDEVHMLSRHSFNALLKTLEEPPEYVKFLLATTDPQKLPITILSRCMQFHLRALDQTQIAHHLEFILKEEQIPYETAAIEKLAKAAEGSIRDSLSLTDQAIAVSNANITLEAVRQMLGLLDDHQPIELVSALANADGERAMAVIQNVAEKGVEWTQLLNDLAETLHNIAMLQLLKSAEKDSPLHFLANTIAPEDVQFFYQVILAGKKELPFAPEQRAGVEMTILRALAFHPKRAAEINQRAIPAVTNENSTGKAQTQNTITQLRERLAPPAAPSQAVKNVTENANPPMTGELNSPALQAMQAQKQLQAQQAQLQQTEKKKSEPLKAAPNLAAHSEKKAVNLHQRFMDLTLAKQEQPVANVESKKPPKKADNEEYRWTWLNPELEMEEEAAKPSDIKQAILQDRTPELVAETIRLSCEQDQWCNIVHSLKLGGLSRQLALNSYLDGQNAQHLNLILKSEMAHLDNPESRQSLATALEEKGFTYQLAVGQSDEHKTPLEIRRSFFEQLTQEARKALQEDARLQLLKTAFNAEIDEATIRAVAPKTKKETQ